MNKKNRCLNIIKKIIEEANLELDRINLGEDVEATKEQINNVIIPEMIRLTQEINIDHFPDKLERFSVSFSNAFKVWGWNIQNPTNLFKLLLEFNKMHKRI